MSLGALIRGWKRRLRAVLLPVPAVTLPRYLAALAHDVLHPRHGELIPPTRLMFDGSQNAADYRRDGIEFMRYFVELGGLRPNDRVLEIGCAIGRKAIPLVGFLNGRGSYDGFDIVELGIEWCERHITPRFPRFRFHRADVYNTLYHERGRFRAFEYRFPFEDGHFDFAFATSVFTHMLPQDLDNYVGELARVLAPGGRCLASFLLLNEEAERCIDAGKSKLTLRHPFGPCRTESAATREAAIGYPESFVRALFAAKHLTLVEPIHFGSWCGRDRALSFQDIVVAARS